MPAESKRPNIYYRIKIFKESSVKIYPGGEFLHQTRGKYTILGKLTYQPQ